MGLANIVHGQAALSSLADSIGFPSADVEQFITIAWQWLVLAALIAWTGALIGGYRLFTAFKRQQQSEIVTVLHMAAQRQRRQSWLWLTIILAGIVALFWLRISPVLLPQQLDPLPNWPALGFFMLQTPEGWLWLARGGLALLAGGLLAGFVLSDHRRAQRAHMPEGLARSERARSRFPWEENARPAARNATLIPDRPRRVDLSNPHLTTPVDMLEPGLLAERRHAQISLAVVGVLLCTFLLPLTDGEGAPLPMLALALRGGVLFALAAWLGSSLYLPTILVPATHIIEGAERTQTLVAIFPASRLPIIQALVPITFYSLFSVETRLTGFSSLPLLLSAPAGWLLIAEFSLLGFMLLLTLYQARWALPALVQAAWLAARGMVMSVLGGVDVSQSLQVSQRERQTLANRAERRLIRAAYAQLILGMLVLFCLVLSLFMVPPGI